LDLMAEFFPGAQLRAEPDYAAALWACPPKTDVCVIAGTGSLVCSKGGPEMRKSGGRGYLLGDEGSSFAIGRDALRAALDDPSQTGPELLEIIAEMLGTDPVSSVYKLQAPARVLAKLAVPLGTDLKAGRPYARAVFEHNMEALAAVVVKHVTDFEIGADPLAICVTGGLWKIAPTAPQIFQRALEQRMKDRQLDVYRIRTAPIHGAVALAKEMKSGN
jgi:N-acetylglucosamine kinase-like BadF-type ATPase